MNTGIAPAQHSAGEACDYGGEKHAAGAKQVAEKGLDFERRARKAYLRG
jgi:hypothetical protein